METPYSIFLFRNHRFTGFALDQNALPPSEGWTCFRKISVFNKQPDGSALANLLEGIGAADGRVFVPPLYNPGY